MTVVDGVCPLMTDPEAWDLYIEGGVDIAVPTVANWETPDETLRLLQQWRTWTADDDRLLSVTEPDHFEQLPDPGRLGIIVHFQNASPMGEDLSNYERFHRLGLRMVQLCYNFPNLLGDGCLSAEDAPLTSFGHQAIREMNRLGIVVDLSHTGRRTTLDAIRATEAPPVFSHSNPSEVTRHRRNIDDEQIRAVAEADGMVGVVTFPPLVKPGGKDGTVSHLIDHIDYLVDLIGSERVGLGLDFCESSPDFMAKMIGSGGWSTEDYPPDSDPRLLDLASPTQIPNIRQELVRRGYPSDAVAGIMGNNWINLFKRVWESAE